MLWINSNIEKRAEKQQNIIFEEWNTLQEPLLAVEAVSQTCNVAFRTHQMYTRDHHIF